jgi:hypothetical protein
MLQLERMKNIRGDSESWSLTFLAYEISLRTKTGLIALYLRNDSVSATGCVDL